MYLELDGSGPRYAQLIRALKSALLDGRLKAGERLPSSRELAAELGVSRNTVLEAYDQLLAEGFVYGRGGSGTFVADFGERPRPRRRPESIAPPSRYARRSRQVHDREIGRQRYDVRYNLQYGEPLVNPALVRAWNRELSRAAREPRVHYPGARGLTKLRAAIADYLRRRRGLDVDRNDVLIVNGAQQAFDLVTRVLIDEGDRVALEEPNYFGIRQSLQAHGAKLVPIPVDADGIVTSRLPTQGLKLTCVTPSHQFPSGAVLSLARRLELLRHASATGCWIVEDDYDGEFRYDARPLAALRALDDADRVIYIGTFSKMLFPALRLGYLVLPAALKEDFLAAKWLADFACPGLTQAALANFMHSPAFDTHLRNATRTLKKRRKALLDGLATHAGDRVEVIDNPAGMHVTAWLNDLQPDDVPALIDLAGRRGLGVFPIAPHYLVPPPRAGLLLGFAALPAREITEAMRVFGKCLDDFEPSRRQR